MPTPEEVDAVGVAQVDVNGHVVTVARWESDTFEGRAIDPGRWYHALSSDGVTSYGLINADGAAHGEFYAYAPASIGEGLGEVVSSLNAGLKALVRPLDAG